ncbi:cytochrome c oxidase accessory protein CcoG [Phragmitibacter flavus]|uniref:Cytochrome c oxidase accessory protein CcoG n=1 Tax=Phragmitibacter flavus TaxID=2576071 RepID=A0A5R8KFR6_9BACT|nr:cytochrome c oxidase accessory protein CcoG [Phragmitibacter flavus]TLD70805.1 cytochrome c oxidase accessory protein CcoG [Phragmitibacter flavus]
MPPITPNLDSVTTIAKDGSRQMLHPADVRGPFAHWRRLTALVLILVYIALPWIPINGHPAVFFDTANLRFHFLGITFATQDLWLGFFVVTGLAFSLYYLSAFFGRVWCGWTCPYTVFLEHIFRRVERLIEGDAVQRRKLDSAPWTSRKIRLRLLKHSIYLLLSTLIAHIFISYFISLRTLYQWMQGPPTQHLLAFGIMLFLTGAIYFSFSWFREQFCIILCPYGRLQSALTDDHTVVIGYDKIRGEPRGKSTPDAPAGDCVNCLRCVQVCPTGIDIRNGLQMECIGCTACVDACNDVMIRLKRPTGLVRFDSMVGLQGGKTRYLRPRTLLYTVFFAIGIIVFAFGFSTIKPLRISSTRMTGAPYFLTENLIRNQFQVRIINKRNIHVDYQITLPPDAPAGLQISGTNDPVTVAPGAESIRILVLTLPKQNYQDGPIKTLIHVTELLPKGATATRAVEFLGPDPRIQNDDYLNPQNYLK